MLGKCLILIAKKSIDHSCSLPSFKSKWQKNFFFSFFLFGNFLTLITVILAVKKRSYHSCSVPSFQLKFKFFCENILTLIAVILAVNKRIDHSCSVPSFKSKLKKTFFIFFIFSLSSRLSL